MALTILFQRKASKYEPTRTAIRLIFSRCDENASERLEIFVRLSTPMTVESVTSLILVVYCMVLDRSRNLGDFYDIGWYFSQETKIHNFVTIYIQGYKKIYGHNIQKPCNTQEVTCNRKKYFDA